MTSTPLEAPALVFHEADQDAPLNAGSTSSDPAPVEIPPPALDPIAPVSDAPRETAFGPVVPVRRGPSYVFLAAVAILTLASDLGTKWWAEKALANSAPRPIIKGVFGFVLAKNRGGAWGLLQTSSEHVRKPFFVIVSLLAIVFIVSLYRRLHVRQAALRWGLPLVLGGALGNLVDRIRYGYVIDFIDCQATYQGGPHHWPTFNVADVAICVGVALMAIDMLSARKKDPPPPASEIATPSTTYHPAAPEPPMTPPSEPHEPGAP